MDKMYGKTLVFLISGKAGVGKSTFGKIVYNIYTEIGKRAITVPFASGIKRVCKVLGWDGEKDEKGRRLLIAVGQVLREYDVNTWAKIAEMEIHDTLIPYDVVIIDDWRFPNEMEFMEGSPEYEVITVRINSSSREMLKDTEFYNDISETSLPESGEIYEFEILNEGNTIEDLKLIADTVTKVIDDRLEKFE